MANNRIDAEALLARHSIYDVVDRYLTLKREGPHYKCTCPFHDDAHASLIVTPSKNIAKCFACGWSGDAIAFVMEFTGKTFPAACKEIDADLVSEQANTPKRAAIEPKRTTWAHIVPAPGTGEAQEHYLHGKPSRMWTYQTASGEIVGHICRFDLENGDKEVIPLTYCSDGARKQWRWQGFERPRPLYNLHLIAANPNATILIVEGEKSADAAQAQLDPAKTIATCWPGGSMAIEHIDWLPLHGRKVIFWPDNDVQGLSAMLHIAHLNAGKLALSKFLPLDATLEKGWDCADKEWKQGELGEWVRTRMVADIPPNHGEQWQFIQIGRETVYQFGPLEGRWQFRELKDEQPPQPPPPPAPEDTYQPEGEITFNPNIPPYIPPTVDDNDTVGYTEYFSILGWDKTEGQQGFYFFQKQAKTTLRYSASGLSKSALIALAPLRFWESNFPGNKTSISIDGVQEFLIRSSIAAGPFNEKYIRGRGAWVDAERIIIHTGRNLIVDGRDTSLGTIDSRYIYETSDDLGVNPNNPMGVREANKLMDITTLLNWERDINRFLLAGWCVIAPVCGALKWRPHIWLTGSAGTGKSWVFQHVVRRLLGETALAVQGETSEAGLRQTLGHDALPVVFDEADVDDKRSADRVQNILTLMRSASADNGGLLLKGSATGQAKSYSIRSCFAFASIGVQVANQADRSRVTILSMRSLLDEKLKSARWTDLQKLYNEVVTDDYVQRLQARTVKMLPIIIKNTVTFSNAAASVLGEQRTGDQLGAILAGAYSLHSDGEITFDQAVAWVKEKDWSEERGLQGTKDELALLSHIMDTLVQVEGAENKRFERSIGELVACSNGQAMIGITATDAEEKLNRMGLKVRDSHIWVSNSHKYITTLLKDTPWSKNHSKILRRLPNSSEKESMRFGAGVTTRAVGIPLSVLSD